MTDERIIELYNTGDYIPVVKGARWFKPSPTGIEELVLNYECVLIHKTHEHIFDAFLRGDTIYYVGNKGPIEMCNDLFINHYAGTLGKYLAVPSNLESPTHNYYCTGDDFYKFYKKELSTDKGIIIFSTPNSPRFVHNDHSEKYINNLEKLVYNDELGCLVVAPYGTYRYEIESEENLLDIDTFNDYGFETPDFKGEILKKLYCNARNINILIGYIINKNDDEVESAEWDSETGECFYSNTYNLKPIKKPWYMDSDYQGKLFYDEADDVLVILYTFDFKGNVWLDINNDFVRHERFRPATNEEIDSLKY